MVTKSRATVLCLLLPALVGGCAAPSKQVANRPALLTWAAYLQGSDLRLTCDPSTQARFRLVHSGSRNGLVSIIDVAGLPGGGGLAEARRIRAASLAGLGPKDALAAWDGHIDRVRLSRDQFAVLAVRLASDDALTLEGGDPDQVPEVTPQLSWYMTSCQFGSFSFSAYLGEGDPWTDAAFGAPRQNGPYLPGK
jgi:hypothetical protein